MHAPPYSSVPIGGSSWGKSRACTCLAISSSWAHCVEAQQREGVPVHVLEAGEHGAPDRGFVRERCGRRGGRPLILETPQARRVTKANPAVAPFVELGQDIFGDERNLRGPADELVLLGSALGSDQHENYASPTGMHKKLRATCAFAQLFLFVPRAFYLFTPSPDCLPTLWICLTVVQLHWSRLRLA